MFKAMESETAFIGTSKIFHNMLKDAVKSQTRKLTATFGGISFIHRTLTLIVPQMSNITAGQRRLVVA